MHPIHHGTTATVSEMGLMIAVGSVKAQDLKAKSVYRSKPPRATRARDKVTQRMANIFVIPRSEIEGTKPPYVCPRCFIHTYSNNMINRFHVQ
jgi:IMP cyclohydrolase